MPLFMILLSIRDMLQRRTCYDTMRRRLRHDGAPAYASTKVHAYTMRFGEHFAPGREATRPRRSWRPLLRFFENGPLVQHSRR